jgi:hypothetical protein
MKGKYDLIVKDGLVVGSRSIQRQDIGVKEQTVPCWERSGASRQSFTTLMPIRAKGWRIL